MNRTKFVTCKELEDVVELDERHIRRARTQHRLGLDACRDHYCDKPIRFHRHQAAKALRQRGFMADFDE